MSIILTIKTSSHYLYNLYDIQTSSVVKPKCSEKYVISVSLSQEASGNSFMSVVDGEVEQFILPYWKVMSGRLITGQLKKINHDIKIGKYKSKCNTKLILYSYIIMIYCCHVYLGWNLLSKSTTSPICPLCC